MRPPGKRLRRKLQKFLTKRLKRLKLRVLDVLGFETLDGMETYRTIVDVGVADGTFDLYDRFPNARYFLFEPNPDHAAVIERDILGRIDGRFFPCALGDREMESTLHLTGRTGSSLLKKQDKDYGRVRKVTVPVKRLDAVLFPDDILRPALLKIDVEGFDFQVLRGAGDLIDLFDDLVIEVRFGGYAAYNPQDLLDHARAKGFHLRNIAEVFIEDRQFLCADFFFKRAP